MCPGFHFSNLLHVSFKGVEDGIARSETDLPAPGVVPSVLVIDPGPDVVRGVLRIPATHESASD
jgi:hypothetical protein